ncbi:unnamed protein product [Rotaria sordida]|uniref:DDE Tnp4 domain-containing protein n=1 Tax=Rotaria sordida TaxID=392033 RepID=A0A816ACP2_9BILA|nr:unnamed protein product [Rotaria sordida]CAF1334022.1 unnamed protein product [Rotaria sordida]CAF1593301.1 unnamed protein product [Rotaria sordida]CAF1593320.1 unnamed protein product [Rotaria sordida]
MEEKQQQLRALDDKLISIPANISSSRTPYGPQRYHKLIVDSTFIAIPKSYDSQLRKAYYHAKSSTNYALKVQIACDFHHRIVHVSECYRGSVHDITVLRESGLLEHVNDDVQIIGDKGYIDEEYVVTPRKKSRGRELTDEDKDFNYDINSARAAIENINQRLKTYAILGGVYRGAIDDFHKTTKIVQVKNNLILRESDKSGNLYVGHKNAFEQKAIECYTKIGAYEELSSNPLEETLIEVTRLLNGLHMQTKELLKNKHYEKMIPKRKEVKLVYMYFNLKIHKVSSNN